MRYTLIKWYHILFDTPKKFRVVGREMSLRMSYSQACDARRQLEDLGVKVYVIYDNEY